MRLNPLSPADPIRQLLPAVFMLLAPVAGALTINYDISLSSAGHYTGGGVAPDTGTTWNSAIITGSASTSLLTTVKDSRGNTIPGVIYLYDSGQQPLVAASQTWQGNPKPLLLMQDYVYGGNYQMLVGSLAPGNYILYVFAHGAEPAQAGSVKVSEVNGGAAGSAGVTGDQYRNLLTAGAEGYSYLKFDDIPVGQDGVLSFAVTGYLNGFQLIKKDVPVIQTQPPAALGAYLGLGASLPVVATSTEPMSWQWQWSGDGGASFDDIDPVANPSAATATLILARLTYADAGQYRVVVSTQFGSVTSTATTLSIESNPAPLFSLQPVDQLIGFGEPAVFSAEAFAEAGTDYQWYKDGVAIPGATGPDHAVSPVTMADAGTYHVVASNAFGATTSDSAVLRLRLPAFPGADGPGAEATGGRGGDVYHVTNLDDDIANPPPGSLRHALKNVPPEGRTVVFDVAGLVFLDPATTTTGWLRTEADNLTIAGQTAPHPGITIGGQGTKFSGNNNVLRHLKIRPGKHQVNPGVSTNDGISNYLQNSIIDHMSVSWADDELLSSTDLVDSTTVQFCLIGEGLYYDLEGGKTHAYGSLINSEVPNAPVSYHHNLYAHVQSRLPRIQAMMEPGLVLNWANNVIYNWYGNAGYSGAYEPTRMNFIGNYYIAGNNTRSTDRAFNSPSPSTRIYYQDNYRDRNKDGLLNGTDPGATVFIEGNFTNEPAPFTEVAIPELDPASDVVGAVTQRAGAFWWERDEVDTRIVNDTLNQTGQFITEPAAVGGWDQRAAQRPPGFDRDGDGMSDAWETAHGLNPLVHNPHSDINGDGYSNLQNYLNDLGAFRQLREPSWIVDGGRYADPTSWYRWWQPSRFDTVVIGDGTVVIDSPGNWAGDVRFDPENGATAQLLVEGGWWQVAGDVQTAAGGDVALGQSGGIVRVDGALKLGSIHGTAEYTLTGGTLYARRIELGAGGSLILDGGILRAGTIDAASVVLSGARLAPGSDHEVEQLAAALGDRALVAPVATTAGTTTVTGDLDLSGGSLEISVEAPGHADSIEVAGQLVLGGTLLVAPAGGYLPAPGTGFVIARAGGISGEFAHVPNGWAVTQAASGELVLTYAGNVHAYLDWAAALPFPQPADSLPGADPDGDGWSNQLEYAFDGDPLTPDLPAGLPDARPAGAGVFMLDAGTPLLRFAHRRSGDLSYVVETSPDLQAWTPLWTTGEDWAAPAVEAHAPGLLFDELVLRIGSATTSPVYARVQARLSDDFLLVAPLGLTGATDLPPDVPPSLVFNRAVKSGDAGMIRLFKGDGTLVSTIDLAAGPRRSIGDLRLNYRPVTTSGSAATILFDRGAMQYGQTYYVTVDAGVILDSDGNPWAGVSDDQTLRFTTRAGGPAGSAARVTVDWDGSGDFCTVQGAIENITTGMTERVTIEVADGWYQELVYLAGQLGPVTLRGESRDGTVISYANNASFNPTSRASFRNRANDLTLERLTLLNTTPKGGSQAEAFQSQASRVVVRGCAISSYQDTVRIDKSAYLENCYIEGDVDYIWGDGVAYFDNCHLHTLNKGYLVQARNEGAGHGFIFRECLITGAPTAAGTYLARIDPNVYPQSEVVFLNCAVDGHIHPAGWLLNGAASAPELRFFEYESTTPAGSPLDVSARLPDSAQLDAAQAAPFLSVPAVLGFDPAGR